MQFFSAKNICLALLVIASGAAFWLPRHAGALSGLAEHTSVLEYNERARVLFGHPSDMCVAPEKRQVCFMLLYPELQQPPSIRLRSLMLEQINQPWKPDAEYALVQSYTSNEWIIFDLRVKVKARPESEDIGDSFKEIIRTPDYQTALQTWKKLGLPAPKLVQAVHLANSFKTLYSSQLAW